MSSAPSFIKLGPRDGIVAYPGLYSGKGVVKAQLFFRDAAAAGAGRATGAASPALLLTYTIPPGASEGVHTHRPGDGETGSFDEFYYILEGRGEMEIGGERVAVEAGDHVFTPNGVPHGIENTAPDRDLKVYVVAIQRG